jgi:hypothetical protein
LVTNCERIGGEERKVYKVLVGKPEGKRPLGRPRHRWEDGIRMDIDALSHYYAFLRRYEFLFSLCLPPCFPRCPGFKMKKKSSD